MDDAEETLTQESATKDHEPDEEVKEVYNARDSRPRALDSKKSSNAVTNGMETVFTDHSGALDRSNLGLMKGAITEGIEIDD